MYILFTFVNGIVWRIKQNCQSPLFCLSGYDILEPYNVLVKRNLVFSATKVVYELPRKLPSNLKFRKIENFRETSNLGRDIKIKLL